MIENKCYQCGKEMPKSNITKRGLIRDPFCSDDCADAYNDKINKENEGKCSVCKKPYKHLLVSGPPKYPSYTCWDCAKKVNEKCLEEIKKLKELNRWDNKYEK